MQKIYKNFFLRKVLLIIKIIIIFINIFIFLYFTEKYYELQRKKKLEKGVAVCTIIKSENSYIKEFIEYYKKLGVKKIFIYDNYDNRDESYRNIFISYLKSGFLEIENIKGRKILPKKVFYNCFTKYKNKYDWVLFIDIDKFLYINNNQTLDNLLLESRYEYCQVIKINCLYYGDNENKEINENVNSKIISTKVNHHLEDINMKNTCDIFGKPVYYKKNIIYTSIHKFIYLKHYKSKIEENYGNDIFRGGNNFFNFI